MRSRLFKSVISISAVTVMALAYVHQQVELVKLSYAIEKKEKKLEHILDRKERLEYNINYLEEPSRLEKMLSSRNIEIAMPKRNQVVNIAGATKRSLDRNQHTPRIGIEKRHNILSFFEFLGFRTEAQAKE